MSLLKTSYVPTCSGTCNAAYLTVHAVIRSIVPFAWIDEQLLGEIRKIYVNEILVSPDDFFVKLLLIGDHFLLPSRRPHPVQMHQHHARVHPQLPVIWMLSEAIVP